MCAAAFEDDMQLVKAMRPGRPVHEPHNSKTQVQASPPVYQHALRTCSS